MSKASTVSTCGVCGRTDCEGCCFYCGGSLDECHELCDPGNYACVCLNEWCDEHHPDGPDF